MCFVDTVKLYAPFYYPLSNVELSEIKDRLRDVGCRVYDHKNSFGDTVFLQTKCPKNNFWSGNVLTHVSAKINKKYAQATVNLGTIIRGHNVFMDNAEISSQALREWVFKLTDALPGIDVYKIRIEFIDVTYQFKGPESESFISDISINLASSRGVVYKDLKSRSLYGKERSTLFWSIYDKSKREELKGNFDIIPEEFRPLYRITERVYRKDPLFPTAFSDINCFMFCQKGLIDIISRRWDGLRCGAKDSYDLSGLPLTQLLNEYRPGLLAEAIQYLQNPELYYMMLRSLEDKNSEKNYRARFSKVVKPCMERIMESMPKTTFTLKIPPYDELISMWREGNIILEV